MGAFCLRVLKKIMKGKWGFPKHMTSHEVNLYFLVMKSFILLLQYHWHNQIDVISYLFPEPAYDVRTTFYEPWNDVKILKRHYNKVVLVMYQLGWHYDTY